MQSWKRLVRRAAQILIVVLITLGYGKAAGAQTANLAHTQAATSHIDATSAPFHMTWDGATGVFQRDPLGNVAPLQLKMTFLHTDPGPRGYAKYLAWFLARDSDSFMLLWCYLNDSGRDFYIWLYSYPDNQLTSLHFTGKYTFTPPAEPTAAVTDPTFALRLEPRYAGPDFVFRDWTRSGGSLPRLDLRPAAADHPAATDTAAVVHTLTQVTAVPLQEIRVPSGNGWRNSGWRELHCLAQDVNGDPYYLILYSNATRGFVVDLKRAQTYVADYGQTVMFQTTASIFGQADDRVTGPPELRIGRFSRQELNLTASETYSNPYTQVDVVADFRGPGGLTVTVPGFWDGGSSWIIRFTPDQDGPWTWRTRSQDLGMDGQQGSFTCIANSESARGFVGVSSNRSHHFAFSDGTPFLPVSVYYPFNRFAESRPATVQSAQGTALDAGFQRDVDALAALGFSRFLGGRLIAPHDMGNEGGTLFVDNNPEQINPAYFRALDHRVAYCNAKGIMPDLGIGTLNADLLTRLTSSQLSALWHYVVARYAAYNVCWNLFDREIGARVPDGAQAVVAALVAATAHDDPMHHPVTTVSAGSATPVAPEIMTPADPPAKSQSQFVQSQAGMPLFPDASGDIAQRVAAVELAEATTPASELAGLDIITLNGGDLQEIAADYGYGRPIAIYDRSAPPTPDAARYRLWETWLRGGIWARDHGDNTTGSNLNPGALQDEVRWVSYCGKLFGKTQYWKLAPHNELLHKPVSAVASPQTAGLQQSVSGSGRTGSGGGSSAGPEGATQTPIFLLADPAWEYVAYFEHGGTASLDLLEATGEIEVTWFNPRTGDSLPPDNVMGGSLHTFHAPDNGDWVLHLARK